MRIALVHDMLTQYGGAEKVLKAIADIYPKAPIFTLIYNEKKLGHIFSKQRVKPSFLQKLPFAKSKFQCYLPLMPSAIENYDFKNFDLIISSASALTKGVITSPSALHICYCHTPTRYLWLESQNYIDGLKYNKLIKLIIKLYLPHLRIWDSLTASRVDKFVANSYNVKKRIKKFYNRDSFVIYPPVDVKNFFVSKKNKGYFLIGGRMVPYKKFDIAIRAFNKLNIPLKIFGTGPDYKLLKRKANKNIEFLGFIKEEDKPKLYSEARAFLYPQEEDFGITLIEAMASGVPVIAYKFGGAVESVNEGVSGEFFLEQTWESLAEKIVNFDDNKYNRYEIAKSVQKFSKENFKKRMKDFIEANINHLKNK
ncbi:MAG: glycosyltransferase [Xanthomonadaceae bacterium]|nr:glycosyltransferase [Rhodospirillaceae bacterium]NIA18218.1 glycosyltransferase [Xanthomonadaceae bacterium]